MSQTTVISVTVTSRTFPFNEFLFQNFFSIDIEKKSVKRMYVKLHSDRLFMSNVRTFEPKGRDFLGFPTISGSFRFLMTCQELETGALLHITHF